MQTLTAEHFVRNMKRHMEEHEARFVFFLGAGCSISSGIPGAARLVRDWLPRLHQEQTGGAQEFDAWLEEEFPDHDKDNPAVSYAPVFQRLCHTPLLRQRAIEKIVTRKDPSFGYAVLAQLMTHPKFGEGCNRILTTNFDDLVADALYLYTRTKPLVIVHESLIGFVEVGRNRPLVIKLHGDALLDPKNLEDETAELTGNVTPVLAKILEETGLVFIGYGGNDTGITRFLSTLPEGSLPVGIYWVNGQKPDTVFGQWLDQNDSAAWVQHRDFDTLILLIRREFDLGHPDEKRFSALMDTYKDKFQKLSREIRELPEDDADKAALETAADDARQDFENWFAVELEADRYKEIDSDLANQIYRAGLEQFPESAPLLGNYAIFLKNVREDMDGAEALYKRALEADPNHANSLGNYANFLKNVREDMDGAETLYKRALEADPNQANSLGSYAIFLKNVREDMDGAETLFKRALEADPNHANNLGNYANFLKNVREDMDGAETLYKRALEADPNHANSLGSYAIFLKDVREDMDGAEALYKRALEADPNHANNLGNYAGFLLALGRTTEGFEKLQRAFAKMSNRRDLELECEFYRFAHSPEASERTKALTEIKKLIGDNTRSPGWDLSKNVERAGEDGHPEIELIAQLAKVIADEADAETLNKFPAWKRA